MVALRTKSSHIAGAPCQKAENFLTWDDGYLKQRTSQRIGAFRMAIDIPNAHARAGKLLSRLGGRVRAE